MREEKGAEWKSMRVSGWKLRMKRGGKRVGIEQGGKSWSKLAAIRMTKILARG